MGSLIGGMMGGLGSAVGAVGGAAKSVVGALGSDSEGGGLLGSSGGLLGTGIGGSGGIYGIGNTGLGKSLRGGMGKTKDSSLDPGAASSTQTQALRDIVKYVGSAFSSKKARVRSDLANQIATGDPGDEMNAGGGNDYGGETGI